MPRTASPMRPCYALNPPHEMSRFAAKKVRDIDRREHCRFPGLRRRSSENAHSHCQVTFILEAIAPSRGSALLCEAPAALARAATDGAAARQGVDGGQPSPRALDNLSGDDHASSGERDIHPFGLSMRVEVGALRYGSSHGASAR